MRGISGLVFGLGLGVLLTCGQASAQDAAKPAVQVIIGADGSVKVVDPKTGNEIPSAVVRTKDNPRESKADDRQTQQAQKQLEQARKELERVLQAQERTQLLQRLQPDAKTDKIQIKEIELHIKPGTDGKPQIITLQRVQRQAAKPATLEQKIDLILKQMEELRRDVNQLKSNLEGKKPDRLNWQLVPDPKAGKDKKPDAPRILIVPIDKDKKPGTPQIQIKPLPDKQDRKVDKETIERLRDLLRKLEAESKDKRKILQGELRNEKQPVDRNVELERRLERILQEAEELRREIRKTKPATK